ncbi:MAG: hypothetical protein LBG05_03310 [Treponema sp.]|jgi:hypothetical protein|nr:hypothetical protein [Treponema sp.]
MDDVIQPQMGLTFEHIWSTILELAEQHKETERFLKESKAETERFLKESKAETDRRFQECAEQLAEQHKETERAVKELAEQHKETERTITKMNRELNQAIGKLGNRFGELVEHLVSPNLLEKFKVLGYAFGKSSPRVKYKDVNTGEILAEVDALLENGDCALAVEIKADPSIEDVKDHIKRMETLRGYADAHNDRRDYLGAIAGGIVGNNVKNYALKNGFYVLEQSGDTMSIAAVPEAWEPKRW